MQEKINKLKEIVNNQALIEQLKNAESEEAMLAMLAENGLDITAEELRTLGQQLVPQDGELSEDALENVAGGGWFSRWWNDFWAGLRHGMRVR